MENFIKSCACPESMENYRPGRAEVNAELCSRVLDPFIQLQKNTRAGISGLWNLFLENPEVILERMRSTMAIYDHGWKKGLIPDRGNSGQTEYALKVAFVLLQDIYKEAYYHIEQDLIKKASRLESILDNGGMR